MGGGAMNVDIPMFPCKTPTPILPSLNASSSGLNFPVSVDNTPSSAFGGGNESRLFNQLLGPAPSAIEVESAISGLQNFLRRSWSSETDTLGGGRNGGVKEVLGLLLTEPTIQRVVFSISSDKAVWDAVMSNEMVRQLQGSYVFTAHSDRIQGFKGESDLITWIIDWIMDRFRAKVSQLIQKFELLMDQVFTQTREETQNDEEANEIDDMITSSFILSIVVLLIVAVTRFQRN